MWRNKRAPQSWRGLRFVAVGLLLTQVAPAAWAQQLPRAESPAAAGMSAERIGRIRSVLDASVAEGAVAGAVALVLRDGHVVAWDSAGLADIERRTPMRGSAIFRIASMSKAVTSVAVMMLQEDGKLLLSDQLSRYLPEFQQMQVLVTDSAGRTSLVPARRQITIRDLLTHQSGIAYEFNNAGPVGNAYRAAGIHDGLGADGPSLEENVRLIATQPLVHHPGEANTYGLNTDVLGRLVEVVSGMPFDRFLRERLFQPLRMLDTHFWVPDNSVSRIATPYTLDAGRLRAMTDPERFDNTILAGRDSRGSTYHSGGGGLYSTALDYARFLQMLLNGGELEGARILSPKSVELMTVSHSSALSSNLGGAGQSFGLGFAILEDLGAAAVLGSPGLYRWGGIYGTTYWVDPVERIVAVMMIQRYPTTGLRLANDFRVAVYQAIARSHAAPAAGRN